MTTPREFAVKVVEQLQQAGFEAVWAGGCVRDQLLGLIPKDYDIATNARPEQVRELFGQKRTLAIGAAFGVIAVLGPKSAGQIDVATFRSDAAYSDGRHPDSVSFSDARHDAERRDFTINGMFFDPIRNEVVDYVNGRRDIDERTIRAIGNPHERIAEDKLRMMRAVRFAAAYSFAVDPETSVAIREHAAEINVVSGERIGQEMRRMLTSPTRAVAVKLLKDFELLAQIIPGGELLYANRGNWNTRLRWLEALGKARFETAAAMLLANIIKEQGIEPIAARWKLSTVEQRSITWIDANWLQLTRAANVPWSQIQPLLIHTDAADALQLADASVGRLHEGLRLCRERLAWDRERLDPKPLIDGLDLQAIGLKPGPQFSRIITAVRAAQLDGQIIDKQQAIACVQELGDPPAS